MNALNALTANQIADAIAAGTCTLKDARAHLAGKPKLRTPSKRLLAAIDAHPRSAKAAVAAYREVTAKAAQRREAFLARVSSARKTPGDKHKTCQSQARKTTPKTQPRKTASQPFAGSCASWRPPSPSSPALARPDPPAPRGWQPLAPFPPAPSRRDSALGGAWSPTGGARDAWRLRAEARSFRDVRRNVGEPHRRISRAAGRLHPHRHRSNTMAINATTAATIINLTNERLGHLADELGTLREQIRSLQAREGEVAKAIRESCAEVTQGVLFRVSVKRRSQRTLDTTALRKTLPEAVWAPFLRASEQIRLETSRLA